MLIVLGILLFIALVVVHEFGHFLAAKRSGVEVEEFGLGFPPRVWGRRLKGDKTLYSINLLPLGGFVRLKGEHDADRTPRSYGAAPFKKKAFIIIAGVVMNLLLAAVILTVLSFTGLPRVLPNQFTVASDTKISRHDVVVSLVTNDGSADLAGIELGDQIKSFDGVAITEAEELYGLTEARTGRDVEVVVVRDGQTLNLTANLPETRTDKGILGLTPGDIIYERSAWSAPVRGVILTAQFVWETLAGLVKTLGQLVTGQGSAAAENVTGPVGIVVLLREVSAAGLTNVLFFIALISLTLAVMNILPIPALDGGRLFVSSLFRLMKKPLNARTEERIHATGMTVLLGLIILITIVDVRRFF